MMNIKSVLALVTGSMAASNVDLASPAVEKTEQPAQASLLSRFVAAEKIENPIDRQTAQVKLVGEAVASETPPTTADWVQIARATRDVRGYEAPFAK